MATKRKKAKAKKSSKPKSKKTSKPKMKKRAVPKKRVMAKKGGKLKRNVAAIANPFYGTYSSSVEEISSMDGTLLVPASPTNTGQVTYILSSDDSSHTVTPSFNGNLISFSFTKGTYPYSYRATSWTPASGLSGGTWTGTASGPPSPIVAKGDWTAGT